MLTLLRRYSVLFSTGTLLALSLALLVTNTRGKRRIDPLGVVFLEVITPISTLMSTVSSTMGRTWRAYVDLVGVRQERDWLRQRVRELEAQAQRVTAIESQNARLQALLDLREGLPGQSVAARLTGVDASGLFRTATINKGENDGVTKGMAVIAPMGVVGRVVSTSPNAARVLLLEDPSSGVDALVQRSRARGIVEGSLNGGCQLKYVKHREDVRVGDLVTTSGLDGIFPKGIPVGTIVRLAREEGGLFQTAEIAPAVDFNKLEEVLVVEAPENEVPPEASRADSSGNGRHGG
ncbi:MAG TPA: rod shape-determining protein MreC [Candidatus Binatia bacterium]